MLRTRIHTCVKFFQGFLLLAIFLSPSLAFAQSEEWSIESYDVVIELIEDGSLRITEDILVNFNVEKHGIFRTIPVSYTDEFGNRVKIGLNFGDIFQDGQLAMANESPMIGDKYLKIGDPEVTITGEHTYQINYEVERGVLFFEDHDEIYWNVTGTDWEVPIKASSAIVRLPEGVEVLQSSCYTGDLGSTDEKCGIATDGNAAAFVAEGNLTVAIGFEKGVIIEPTLVEKLGQSAKDNAINFVPFGVVGLLIIFWLVAGRDPRMETVIAEYDAPQNLMASSVGVIFKTFVASSEISAMVIQLAVLGYLDIEIEQTGKKKSIHLVKKKSDKGLDESHRILFGILFKDGAEKVSTLELKKSVSTRKYRKLRKMIGRILIEEGLYTKGSFFSRNLLFLLGGAQIYGSFLGGIFFGPVTVVLFVFSAAVTFGFALLITRKTGHGTEVLRKIKGYRLYLNTAEKYRLEWQGKEGIFEKHLPYAIALRVSKGWANTFAGMEYSQPIWYHSTYVISSYSDLVTDLGITLGKLTGAVVPQSSGSSGGGSSGGGMGGGGGGSW